MKRSDFRKPGFTLVELLVVIAVIGILVGMLLPAVQAVRESARRTACQSKLKQISAAILVYENTHNHFPPGRIGCDGTGGEMNAQNCPLDPPLEDQTGASGFVSILPQLQQQQLKDCLAIEDGGLWNWDSDVWYLDTGKSEAVRQHLGIYWCPSENSNRLNGVYYPIKAATSTYAFCNGSIGPESPSYTTKYRNNGAFVYRVGRRNNDMRDGTSNIFLVGEVVRPDLWESSNIWNFANANADCLRSTSNPLNTKPGDGVTLELQNGAFASWHPGGALFTFADGHVQFVNDQIDMAVYRGLSTIDGGELQ